MHHGSIPKYRTFNIKYIWIGKTLIMRENYFRPNNVTVDASILLVDYDTAVTGLCVATLLFKQ